MTAKYVAKLVVVNSLLPERVVVEVVQQRNRLYAKRVCDSSYEKLSRFLTTTYEGRAISATQGKLKLKHLDGAVIHTRPAPASSGHQFVRVVRLASGRKEEFCE